MLTLVALAILAVAVLVISTDQFVTGASTIAAGLKVSSVLVGAVILGCGTGLPELALAFHRNHGSPWAALFGLDSGGGHGLPFALFFVVLVVIMSVPTLVPDLVQRHTPVILFTTITFAALLRGSLDRYEGTAMLLGFAVGIAWIIHSDRQQDFDPFAPVIDDDYEYHGAYIEAPVMTPVQVGMTRVLLGLLGTAVGAQLLGRSCEAILTDLGARREITDVAFVVLGSILPHVVVAVQALKQHHEGLAIGNLIGSNLFHSLAIGGLVAVIRPYELGGSFSPAGIGILLATALITWLLLHTQDELSQRQGAMLLGAYVVLVLLTVL